MRTTTIRVRWLAALMTVIWCALPAVSGTITHTVTYNAANLTRSTETVRGVDFTRVEFGDLLLSSLPVTAPDLPVDRVRFSVPYNATSFSVSATTSTAILKLKDRQLSNPVVPVLEPEPTSWRTIPDSVAELIDLSIYRSAGVYPSSPVEIIGESLIAGDNRVITVAVYPVSYTPRDMIIDVYESITITLSYEISPAVSPTLQPLSRAQATSVALEREMVSNIVANPEQVNGFAPTITRAQPQDFSDFFSDDQTTEEMRSGGLIPNSRYIAITTSDLKPSLKRLLALKRQKGYSVQAFNYEDIVTTPAFQAGDVILDGATGDTLSTICDNAGKVRQFLKGAFVNGAEYVLLAGESVPFRYRKTNSNDTLTYDHDVPTDLYYSDLNTNWNKNNNTNFGEPKLYTTAFGLFDYGPELYTGRLMARTKNEIRNYTDKLFRYELNPGDGSFNYLRKAIYTKGYNIEMSELDRVALQFGNIHTDTISITDINNGIYTKGYDVINRINNNPSGYLSFHNHGSPTCFGMSHPYKYVYYGFWALEGQTNHSSSCFTVFPGDGLNNLINKNFPNITYSISCVTMPYDTYIDIDVNESTNQVTNVYTYNIDMNIGQSLTLGKDYGSVAYLGNTRDGFAGFSAILESYFARYLRLVKPKVGMAEAWSKHNYSSAHLSATHNLMGDPEFEMWTDTPTIYSNVNISYSGNKLIISGLPETISKEPHYIALCNNTNQAVAPIITTSLTLNRIPENTSIMIYKHNMIPYIAPLYLQNVTMNHSQYVLASSVVAGNHVVDYANTGDVIIPSGVEYEIEAKDTVTLAPGFSVERGAVFAVTPAVW